MSENVPVVQAGQEVQPINYSKATVQTVRDTIFKGATDAELQLYFHKCVSVGCHPLDGLIHPSKFKDGDSGNFRVVFLSSIDLMRSMAEDTGFYNGQDEPEFEYGELPEDANFPHPTSCKVNVYKKGIDRPFVGTADWDEFYPSDPKKQFMWKKLKKIMLAKCAEGQGLRKGFPKKLNKIYAEEEMMQAINATTGGKGSSTKPTIVQQTEVESEVPTGNFIASVEKKTGKNKKGPWVRYGVSINNIKYGTFSDTIGKQSMDLHKRGCEVSFKSEKNGEFYNLLEIWEVQEETLTPEPSDPDPAPVVEDSSDFTAHVMSLAIQVGQKTEEDVNEYLTERGFSILSEIPADKQNLVTDLYLVEIENAKNT